MAIGIETLQNKSSGKTELPITKSEPLIPWEFIWKSGIPANVIFGAAGRFFDHLAARECLTLRGEDEASLYWYNQSSKRLAEYLTEKPLARRVYDSLYEISYRSTVQKVRK